MATNTQAQNNDIFNGGNNDGWHSSSVAGPDNGIFQGGNGDGWHYTSFLQPGNAIFNGGAGDGWHAYTLASADNSIFVGGIGDGWANTYRPMGSLPVSFISFTASKQNDNAALLQWQTSQEINSSYYDVERSEDAVQFVKIGRVNAAGNTSSTSSYSFTDMLPANGINYYRLKQVDTDGRFVYTPVRTLHFGQPAAGAVKYFPNPTNGLLNIEIPAELVPANKLINIINSNGVMVQQLKLSATGSIIPVNFNRYPKGVYFVQLSGAGINSTHRVVLQ